MQYQYLIETKVLKLLKRNRSAITFSKGAQILTLLNRYVFGAFVCQGLFCLFALVSSLVFFN